jgi:DNA-binding CsgD family transcriptional regulator
LRRVVPEFEKYLARGQIEFISDNDWHWEEDQLDLKRVTAGWSDKPNAALNLGYDGIRVSGDAFWMKKRHWNDFCDYEKELDEILVGQKMIALCTYSLRASKAADILDVVRTHRYTIVRRDHDFEILENPALSDAGHEIRRLRGALNILSNPFPGQEVLTPRERVVLAQIVAGASSKEAARILGVSPRTIDFHRANVVRKLGAKNTVDLVRKVVREHSRE